MRSSPLSFRLTLLLSLYVAEGLPSGLCTQALPAIMRSYGISPKVIGFSGILLLPWALKFLWAPYVDRFFSPRLGQRRSWILPTQLLGVITLFGVAFFDPQQLRAGQGIPAFFLLMLLVNTLAATHDIATDGLSVRTLAFAERGLGNGVQVGGYRLGLIGGGGLLLYVLGSWGWQNSFLALSATLFLLLVPALLYREPPPVVEAGEGKVKHPYWEVFRGFFRRPGMRGWLLVLMSCKAGESLGSAMVKPMFVDMGYSLKQIGIMVSVVGCVAAFAGAMLGGWLTGKLGRYRSIVGFLGLQALTIGAYGWLAWLYQQGQPPAPWLVYTVGALEHATGGMTTAAVLTAVMDECRPSHAGADFTLQVSLMTMCGGSLYLVSGLFKEALGYPLFFLFAGVFSLLLAGLAGYACRGLAALRGAVPELAEPGLLRDNAGP